jgi:lipopolysaccharide export system ATP-binding protein
VSATLAVSSLNKTFGRKTAVKSVSFAMQSGEIVGLLGPNGAGKTTVFYMIAGFLRPNSGFITLDDKDITQLPMFERARAGIAYLPQEASVFRRMTVEDNILAVLETRPGLKPEDRARRLDELLDELGIAALRKQKAYTLSGGERRRTEIARALAIEPHFLLLDEPFAGIDPIAVFEIKKIIRHLASSGIGVLITDHNVRDTLDITHRACIINVGEILTQGTKDEILHDDLAREIYLGEHFSM